MKAKGLNKKIIIELLLILIIVGFKICNSQPMNEIDISIYSIIYSVMVNNYKSNRSSEISNGFGWRAASDNNAIIFSVEDDMRL